MSRLGAKAKREKQRAPEWVLVRLPEINDDLPPEPEHTVDPELERIACEWGFVFMLMFMDPQARIKADEKWWYKVCTDEAYNYPMKSYAFNFWWSLRFFDTILRDARAENKDPLTEWRLYLDYKLRQHDLAEGH